MIALLYSIRCPSSLQCSPPPCVPLHPHLAGAPSKSKCGCGALSIFLFPPPAHLPFPPHAAAIRSGAPTLSSFILKKKSENAATCETYRSTRAAQHDLCKTTRVTLPRRSSGRSERGECRRRQNRANAGEPCDGSVKELQWGRGGGEEKKKEGMGRGWAPQARRLPSQGAAASA